MTNKNKYTSQRVALAPVDQAALAKLAAEQKKTQSEVSRDAIRWYLDSHETVKNVDRDDRLINAIYRCTDRIVAVSVSSTNRICALIVRLCLDTNMVLLLLYRHLPQDKADEIMQRVNKLAVQRIKQRLSPEELDVRKMVGPKDDDSEAAPTA